MRRQPKQATDRARDLRNNATEAEDKLWKLLAPYRPRWTRQLYVAAYYLDLACRRAKLAVELDGSQHHDQVGYDAARTAALETQGWRVIRLWNSDVLTNPEGSAPHVLQITAECLGGTHPQPLLKGRGDEGTPLQIALT